MRKISIIATDYNAQDLKEVLGKLNSMFYRQYHYELIVFEDGESLAGLKNISNLKILKAKKKVTLNQKITAGFEVTDGACTILADFKVLDCYKYIQNLLQLWQNGANIVLSRYKDIDKKLSYKFANSSYNLVANIFGMYEANNCSNTFQLFSKCVADVIKKSPNQNAYLRNTKAWQDYKVMVVTTNNFVQVKENKQKFTALEKFWAIVSLLGLAMLGSFIGLGYSMFTSFAQPNVIGTSYMFIALTALIIGFPSLIISRTKNKYGKCFKKDCYEALFDNNVRRLFDLDLYDERDAGLKTINFDASRVRETKSVQEKTYNHSYEKYVPQILKDGSIAPKRKMEYVGAGRGPVLYSYLSTAQAVSNNQVSIEIKTPKSEKIKTSTKANELNQTIKKLTKKEEDKVVLKQKTVRNASVKSAEIISSSNPVKSDKKPTTKKAETKKTIKTNLSNKVDAKNVAPAKNAKETQPKQTVKTSAKATTVKSATTKKVTAKAETSKAKLNTNKKTNVKSQETIEDLKKQLEDKLHAAIESVRAKNSKQKK